MREICANYFKRGKTFPTRIRLTHIDLNAKGISSEVPFYFSSLCSPVHLSL